VQSGWERARWTRQRWGSGAGEGPGPVGSGPLLPTHLLELVPALLRPVPGSRPERLAAGGATGSYVMLLRVSGSALSGVSLRSLDVATRRASCAPALMC
jgi:hypothetical protein